ncbi:MAG: DUF58 domain-containing protein [Defluviitaleaceae bacterium]|nr:DUF58 domain-containing protein [Defluviitaleaceae bacterium]
MAKNRIAFLIWLLVVACLHVFGNNYGTRVILFASVIIPFISIIVARIVALRIIFKLVIPKYCICGEEVSVYIESKKSSFFPIYTKCRIVCKNLFTGEVYFSNQETSKFLISTNNCGVISFSETEFIITDMFGLFAWKTKYKSQESMLIIPKLFDIRLEIGESKKSTLDSEEYSMQQSGNDPSETFAIREYVAGDSLRSIHWKLSQKTDKLFVRELGLPIANKILILFDITATNEPNRISKMASNAFSISHELITQGVSHTVGFIETATEEYISYEIENYNDLNEAFAMLLAIDIREYTKTNIEVYPIDIFEQCTVMVDDSDINILEI